MNAVIKKTLLFSFCCHLGAFGLFNFTFGNRLAKANFADVYFLGAILNTHDLERRASLNNSQEKLIRPFTVLPLRKQESQDEVQSSVYIKPHSAILSDPKSVFLGNLYGSKKILKPPSPVVMLYPRIPEHFLLYFKDRQSAHIELDFNMFSRGRTRAIAVNRKIASGNLEVDLLSKRYLGHYLFVQQAAFPPDIWQTVKIDLSAKENP